jgi:RNA polymerase sigma-70 factor (ECF subfamily)
MSRVDNLSYEEIAAKMDISTNTVKYHIKTALQRLRAGTDGILAWLIIFGTVFLFFYSKRP